jgi:hypothetical protein
MKINQSPLQWVTLRGWPSFRAASGRWQADGLQMPGTSGVMWPVLIPARTE